MYLDDLTGITQSTERKFKELITFLEKHSTNEPNNETQPSPLHAHQLEILTLIARDHTKDFIRWCYHYNDKSIHTLISYMILADFQTNCIDTKKDKSSIQAPGHIKELIAAFNMIPNFMRAMLEIQYASLSDCAPPLHQNPAIIETAISHTNLDKSDTEILIRITDNPAQYADSILWNIKFKADARIDYQRFFDKFFGSYRYLGVECVSMTASESFKLSPLYNRIISFHMDVAKIDTNVEEIKEIMREDGAKLETFLLNDTNVTDESFSNHHTYHRLIIDIFVNHYTDIDTNTINIILHMTKYRKLNSNQLSTWLNKNKQNLITFYKTNPNELAKLKQLPKAHDNFRQASFQQLVAEIRFEIVNWYKQKLFTPHYILIPNQIIKIQEAQKIISKRTTNRPLPSNRYHCITH